MAVIHLVADKINVDSLPTEKFRDVEGVDQKSLENSETWIQIFIGEP